MIQIFASLLSLAARVIMTSIGSTVNLASRLEGVCSPGRILLSEETEKLLGDEFPAESRGLVEVKGFSAPVKVYEVDPGRL